MWAVIGIPFHARVQISVLSLINLHNQPCFFSITGFIRVALFFWSFNSHLARVVWGTSLQYPVNPGCLVSIPAFCRFKNHPPNLFPSFYLLAILSRSWVVPHTLPAWRIKFVLLLHQTIKCHPDIPMTSGPRHWQIPRRFIACIYHDPSCCPTFVHQPFVCWHWAHHLWSAICFSLLEIAHFWSSVCMLFIRSSLSTDVDPFHRRKW